jgi:(1->4)-alpha-D-glucan 1-alpha-D-glucosylmutase
VTSDSARRRPTASYRLQLQPSFTLHDARAAVPYLAALGVSHLHLSPLLEAVPGSTHGYDTVDHSRISEQLGGEQALRALADAAHAHGLGLIADTVPNHMAVPVPERLNQPLWEVLRLGPESPYARWFDIDWAAHGQVLMPVLADRLGTELDRLAVEKTEDDGSAEPVLRYYDHVLPLRPGTEHLPLPEVLDRQWYRPAWWRLARTELDYRRFFTVSGLIAVRVEEPEVFAATHGVLLRLYREGVLDGFRIDHPDGLADPRGYLRRLADEAPGAYVVVEKILTGEERLPADWPCAGTTGYDALRRIDGVLTEGSGVRRLGALYRRYAPAAPASFDAAATQGRREMTAPQGELAAEVERLARVALRVVDEVPELRDHAPWAVRRALAALLTAYPVYRPYVVPGEPASREDAERIRAAAGAAREELLADPVAAPHAEAADLVRDLALGAAGRGPAQDEFCARFAQTASAVAAKGVEDTAFYRWNALLSVNEVGGTPGRPGVTPEEFHAWCERTERERPQTMTALSTHDTKRSADARARLAVLAEQCDSWERTAATWSAMARLLVAPEQRALVDPDTEWLLWQTVLAAWPTEPDRLVAAVLKSVREAKLRTSWTEPDEAYEQAVEAYARAALGDAALCERVDALVRHLDPAARTVTLSSALLHLTVPGVPDVYQGGEEPLHTLVDPDNRRPADLAGLAERLAALDAGAPAEGLAAEKLRLTATALRLRRDRPGAFTGYTPLAARGPAADCALAFLRGTVGPSGGPGGPGAGGRVLAVATRLPHALRRLGGWLDTTLTLPPGRWTDLLTAREPLSGDQLLADLLTPLPVALLISDDQTP